MRKFGRLLVKDKTAIQEAADTQEQAGMLQTASAQTMTNAVNTFASTVAAGGQMNC